jgi:hypothetical protein
MYHFCVHGVSKACSTHGKDEKCIQRLVGSSDWKREFARNRIGYYGMAACVSGYGPEAGSCKSQK